MAGELPILLSLPHYISSDFISSHHTNIISHRKFQHLAGELPVLLSLPEILRETEGRHHLTSLARLARGLLAKPLSTVFAADRKVCNALSVAGAPLWGREEKIMRQSWQRLLLLLLVARNAQDDSSTVSSTGWTWASCHGALTGNNWGYLQGLGDTLLLISVLLTLMQVVSHILVNKVTFTFLPLKDLKKAIGKYFHGFEL